MNINESEVTECFKLMQIFRTMRSNLAMAMSFARRSVLEHHREDVKKIKDLGFVGAKGMSQQIDIHNYCVQSILMALVSQSLRNYFEMKKIKPEIEDCNLEALLDSLDDREKFISAMRIVRNFVFHLSSTNSKDRKILEHYQSISEKNGGTYNHVITILFALYGFTEKCFMGDLPFFPDEIYKNTPDDILALTDAILEDVGAKKQDTTR